MCGIAGILDNSGISPTQIRNMSFIQRHRGPDDEGYAFVDENDRPSLIRGNDTIGELCHLPHIEEISSTQKIRIGLAHRRLSIIDLSPSGHQPMISGDRKYIIIHNGEVYNYKEIRHELHNLGYDFVSNSDTEVILNSYKEWGVACVERFIGMWAFAIWDSVKKNIFLSRDRFGIKPLYYTNKLDNFAFSSELKALFELNFVSKSLEDSIVYQHLARGKVNDLNMTMFKDIIELPPGHNLIYDYRKSSCQCYCYYELGNVRKTFVEENDKLQSPNHVYKNLFENSINLHLRSDVTVGSCLSGGIDSSTIVSYCVKDNSNHTFNTFTASYREKNIDESQYVQLVVSKYKNIVSNYAYPTSEKFWGDLDKFLWHQDLPVKSTSMYAQWEVMKLASSNNMKVLLDGQGADEILGGYGIFAGIYLLKILAHGKLISFIKNANKLKLNRSINVWNEMGRAIFHLIPDWLGRKIHSEKRLGSHFFSTDFHKAHCHLSGVKFLSRKLDIREASELSLKYGLRDLLRYEDRNSMAFSIESRVPFLDHRLVEYSLSLPDDWKINNGWLKYILRRISEPYLPNEVVWRKDKKGFLTPQRIWKQELKQKIYNYLKDFDLPKIFNKDYIFKACLEDIEDNTQLSEFWRFFLFLKWLEVYQIKI